MFAKPNYLLCTVCLAIAAASIGGGWLWGADTATDADNSQQPAYSPRQCDPSIVVGHDTCTKCHDSELKQWMQTPHYRTFDTLHRTPEAKDIAKRMGLKSIKRNDTCVTCHYTRQEQGARVRVVAGVSCESCHGGAKGWLNMHADYGGPSVTRATETLDHRAWRRGASIAAGMNNPSNVYLMARQCLSCHTVPDERLVNVGGHKAGTEEFELVAWSQGSIRHNFVSSGGMTNQVSPTERLRVMYVVGVMADLEASLLATSKATTAEKFGATSATRAAAMKQRLWEVQRKLNHPLIAKALTALADLEIKLGNEVAIADAAGQVGQAAFEFADVDGAELSAIDGMLPAPNAYKN